jgi:hypothetical protein
MFHPYNPPGILGYCLTTSVCVSAMFAVPRFSRNSFAISVTCLLALLPIVISAWWQQCFFQLLATAGYTGLVPLEVIQHRHRVSFWSGITTTSILLVVAVARARLAAPTRAKQRSRLIPIPAARISGPDDSP